MLVELKKYIFDHLEEWGLEANELTPLCRFNPEANGLVSSPQIGNVVFWFADTSDQPLLVTKTAREKKESWLRHLPYSPKVYAYHQSTLFMEALPGKSYEMELSQALFGPEGNRELVRAITLKHMEEMSQVFLEFSTVNAKEEPYQLGDWIAQKGASLPQKTVRTLQRILGSMPYVTHHILADHHTANIFPGPYFIDQYDFAEGREQEPGFLDPIRFIIAYFRASPIGKLYPDWVLTLGCALHDQDQKLLISKPLQAFFNKLNLSGEVVWALLVLAVLFRMQEELQFHAHNPFKDQLEKDLGFILNQLINSRKLFCNGDRGLLKQIKLKEDSFVYPAEKTSRDITNHPRLLHQDYKNYNLVSMGEKTYAVKRSLGAIDLAALSSAQLRSLSRKQKILESESLQNLKRIVDRKIVNLLLYVFKRTVRKLDKYCHFRYTRAND